MKDISAKFESLDEEKQRRILKAALDEFAENDYEQASTNRIVKNAEIGKGMLFYYFKNKQELYDYLVDYSLTLVMDDYLNLIDEKEPDFIERYKQAAKVKIAAYVENPSVFNFLGTLMLKPNLELRADLMARFGKLQEVGYAKLYRGIDKNLFRDDIDAEKAFQLIRWSIEGYQNELTLKLEGQKMPSVNLEPYWQEFYVYLDILKKSFYKDGRENNDGPGNA